MTERARDRASTVSSTRRAAALVVLWVAAALIAGVPSDAGAAAGSEPRAKKSPVYVNTGPECFAGHSAPPASSKSGE